MGEELSGRPAAMRQAPRDGAALTVLNHGAPWPYNHGGSVMRPGGGDVPRPARTAAVSAWTSAPSTCTSRQLWFWSLSARGFLKLVARVTAANICRLAFISLVEALGSLLYLVSEGHRRRGHLWGL